MMSRLILLGLVAALGVSVQTWTVVLSGIRAIHSWTAEQLAALDGPARSRRDWFDVAPPPEVRLPRFDPIVVDDRALGLADELNRAAEGLDLPAPPVMAQHHSTDRKDHRAGAVRPRDEPRDRPAFDTLESRLVAELWLAIEAPGEGRPDGLAAPSRRSKAAIPPIVCRFTPAPHHVAQGLSTILEHKTVSWRCAVAAWHAHIFVRMGRGLRPFMPTQTTLACHPEVPDTRSIIRATGPSGALLSRKNEPGAGESPQKWDLIEPVPGAEEDVAWELNRFGEGIHGPMPGPSGRSPSRPGPTLPAGRSPELAQAIRLTREAARAWMSVVTAPSALQLSAR
jgi:hypothetical protein